MTGSDLSYTAHFFQKSIDTTPYDECVLGADVGGTRTNIAVAGVKKNQITLLFSLDFETKNLTSFLPALQKTLFIAKDEFGIMVKKACIGAAGIVSFDHSFVELTNIPWNIDAKTLLKETVLDSVFILNDFQVMGYSLNTIDFSDENDVTIIRKSSITPDKKTLVLLGAGTGLGKTVLRYDAQNKMYHAFESEGGHVDLPVYNETELELIRHMQQKNHPQTPVTYEDVLSGNGLVDMYQFLRSKKLFKETEYTKKIDDSNDKPMLISMYRLTDEYCKETFRLFRRFFARCAKNLALDALASGGVFIAGGIAEKNKDIFLSNEFLSEFNQTHKQSDFLKKIPLYLLSNYYLSLQGACYAAAQSSSILNK